MEKRISVYSNSMTSKYLTDITDLLNISKKSYICERCVSNDLIYIKQNELFGFNLGFFCNRIESFNDEIFLLQSLLKAVNGTDEKEREKKIKEFDWTNCRINIEHIKNDLYRMSFPDILDKDEFWLFKKESPDLNVPNMFLDISNLPVYDKGKIKLISFSVEESFYALLKHLAKSKEMSLSSYIVSRIKIDECKMITSPLLNVNVINTMYDFILASQNLAKCISELKGIIEKDEIKLSMADGDRFERLVVLSNDYFLKWADSLMASISNVQTSLDDMNIWQRDLDQTVVDILKNDNPDYLEYLKDRRNRL